MKVTFEEIDFENIRDVIREGAGEFEVTDQIIKDMIEGDHGMIGAIVCGYQDTETVSYILNRFSGMLIGKSWPTYGEGNLEEFLEEIKEAMKLEESEDEGIG